MGAAGDGASSGGAAVAGGAVVPPPPPAAAAEQQQQQRVRIYPDEPRVGVGIVILRQVPPLNQPEVLLIQRGKEPNKGAGGLCVGWRIIEWS